uniref:Chemosensory protein n=2 Tax=Endopterygota TaxID=33392 RepID=A0A0A1CP88_CNAME|nr:chemosensory protein [Cnaphalocrocis medinalis]
MKVVLVLFAVIAVALSAKTTYTSKFDNIDVDNILNNKRLLEGYVKCLMGTGKCTSEGNELKEKLPEALATECEKCTPAQKEKSEKIIRFLVNNRRELWDQLAVKYDPKDEYRQKYLDQAKAKGIDV